MERERGALADNTIPGYKIKKKLGEGAMASVYLAKEEKLQRDVALKVMSPKLLSDTSFIDRFLREARIVAGFSHRNIVTVHDVGSHGKFHYMAMEFLPGGDLSSKLRQGLELEDAVSHVKDIAEGLQYASRKNCIHRDIKPDNIMFAEDGHAVITDFGIARDAGAESEMTMAGAVIGTPQYMSPEQAGAKELDHRTDLYSLGIILYEILTGRPPFKGDSAISTGIMHISQSVPALPAKHAQFQGFIDKALAKDPDDRFQSGREFKEELSLIPLEAPGAAHDDAATLVFSADEMSKEMEAISAPSTDEKLDLETDLSDEFLSSGEEEAATEKPSNKAIAAESAAAKLKKKKKEPDLALEEFEDRHAEEIEENERKEQKEKRASRFKGFVTTVIVGALLGGGAYLYISGGAKEFVDGNLQVPEGLSDLSEQVLGTALSSGPKEVVLSTKEKQFSKLFDEAIREGRLYSPRFDCAEVYLNELIILNGSSSLVNDKANELMALSLDKVSNLFNAQQVSEAKALHANAQRILPHVKDTALQDRNRQLGNTLKLN
jgi:serine/threonine protein kinase